MRLRIELFYLVKIATYNVNGIKARLPRLIEWLDEQKPDVVCLQELKSSDETIPLADIEAVGYRGIWHGQKGFNGVAILSRGDAPVEIQKGLGGEPEDDHSRYIEADVMGVRVASIYLPNGNPQPGPKFDYKLRWMDRLNARAAELLTLEIPVVLAGDYNVVPTEADIWSPTGLAGDALIQPESRAAFRRLNAQGWTDALKARHPTAKMWTFWDAGVDREYRGREKASDHAPTWVILR
jgi:exodeoxyribonuclease III